jgi:hypothetical protein
MKEKIVEVGEGEIELVEVMDLGDAAEETRQWHPIQAIQDSSLQFGRAFFE